MSIRIITIVKVAVVAVAAAVVSAPTPVASAQSQLPQLYLSPSTLTVKKNEVFKVQVRIKSETTLVEGGSVVVTWPENTLEYGGSSNEGNDFRTACPDGLAGDFVSVYLCRAHEGGLKGDHLLGTVTFKALVDKGTKDIVFVRQSPRIATSLYAPDKSPLQYDVKGMSLSFTSDGSPAASNYSTLPESVNTGSGNAPADDDSVEVKNEDDADAKSQSSDDSSVAGSEDGSREIDATNTEDAGSSNMLPWIGAGFLVVLLGAVLLLVQRRRKAGKTVKATADDVRQSDAPQQSDETPGDDTSK